MIVITGGRSVPQTESMHGKDRSSVAPFPEAIDWNEFVATHSPRLYRYFLSRFDHAVACDLVQETLLRLVLKVEDGTYEPSRGPIMAYAFGLAHFVAREASRSSSRGREFSASDKAPWNTVADKAQTPDEKLTSKRTVDSLRRAIASLPQVEQDVISLLVDRDLSLGEISTITEIPLNTIKSHVHRAKVRLRAALAEKEPSEDSKLRGEVYE